MSGKRLYSAVVSDNSSNSGDEFDTRCSSGTSIFNWLHVYQTDDEEVALKKALDLSKVRFFRLMCRFILYYSIR